MHIFIFTHIYLYICIYRCICIYEYIYIHIYMYIYTCMVTDKTESDAKYEYLEEGNGLFSSR
jgi:hypothetical protein